MQKIEVQIHFFFGSAYCAQVLVPATVYSCLAAVFDIFEVGSLQKIELAKKGLCSFLALWDIILPLHAAITNIHIYT